MADKTDRQSCIIYFNVEDEDDYERFVGSIANKLYIADEDTKRNIRIISSYEGD